MREATRGLGRLGIREFRVPRPFLLRVSSEKASFAKQIWETSAILLTSPVWAASFQQQEDTSRLGLHKGERTFFDPYSCLCLL
ncbi:unnamed protein product [Symbiodinium microadriaticum]|nr:unnamed protein product [Symbiodinium microadriaticum]CAE7922084.1 unnamed protein product [Symbiodinium sp. KB8]